MCVMVVVVSSRFYVCDGGGGGCGGGGGGVCVCVCVCVCVHGVGGFYCNRLR